jgi:hypothetical protein
MQYICDAPDGKTWFRLETEAEAAQETLAMRHAVEKHFRREWDKATQSYRPVSTNFIERDIGLQTHIQRRMPLFVTLRDDEGIAHVSAMLPPEGREDPSFTPIIVGVQNGDPYPQYGAAIRALARHFSLALDRDRCFPYAR